MSLSLPIIKENVDLAPFNTLNVHARARQFAEVESINVLKNMLCSSKWRDKPIYVIGGGSNILFLGNFDGLVLHMAVKGRKVVKENDDYIWLKVGAGENWHQTVRYCVERGWGGIENLSLIPGKVGAAPIQNIGAYGVELKEVFESLTAVNIQAGSEQRFNGEQCEFGYRNSIFKQELKGQFVIADVTLKLSKNPVVNTSYGAIRQKLDDENITDPGIEEISDIIIDIRNAKLPDPSELANAGSFFKNPIVEQKFFDHLKKEYPSIPGYMVDGNHTKVPAGWLIEQAGWKGKVVGNAGTYRQQALVIVNHGGATGQELWALAKEIQQSIKEMFDIELIPEVNVVG